MRDCRRMRGVQSPIIPVIRDLIESNPGTISLGQGVVSYGPPQAALDRARGFPAGPESHKYQPVHGIPALLDAIGGKLSAENGIEVAPTRRVVVTAGANMAFVNAVLAIADPGDEIIILKPYYFNYEMAIRIAGCRPVAVSTTPDYQPDLAAVSDAVTSRTRAVVTISPNNPTGAVYPEATLSAVNRLCRERKLYHISDEAYEYFTYNGAVHFSPGSLAGSAEHSISLFSLSKAYGFAGWRIGYMVMPEHLFGAVRKVQDTILICPPVVSQEAATGALSAGAAYCRERLGAISEVRKLMLERLDTVSSFCKVPPADGAFYFLLRLDTDLDDMTIVKRLIREFRVAVIPGNTFGMSNGCYLRVSYGPLTKETAAEGIGRLVRGLRVIVLEQP